jgi:polyribonucleotide nucleotidyltransferase
MTRLQQISFQQSGLQAFDESVVIEKLKLTKDQQEKITKIRDETKQEYLKLRQNRALTFEESKKKDHDLKKKTVDMAIAVLDAKQKELWKELHGETFDFVSANELKERAPERKLNEAERKLETLTDDTIDQKVAAWQPTPDERKIDLIGWADGIRHGIELGRKHNRPIIVHTYNDGRIREGRC